ncbi:MAG: AraC family transcriptional regulator [Gemmatimonadota bacterium]
MMIPMTDGLRNGATATPDSQEDWVGEVVGYLQSRGLAATCDGGWLLRRLLEVSHENGRMSVTRIAQLLHMSRRTLGRRTMRAGIPHPRQVLAFGRVLRTTRTLRETGWTMDRAARATGWPDPFGYSNTIARLTGMRPTEARTRDLTVLAEGWLQAELAEGRVSLQEPEPPPCPTCGRELRVGPARSFSKSSP